MKKVLLFGLIGFFTLLISCSSSKTPEEVAVSFYESSFSGNYDKASSYVRDEYGSSLDGLKKEKFIKYLTRYIENFKKRHGNIKNIIVDNVKQIEGDKYRITLNLEFIDGYREDEHLNVTKHDSKWVIGD